MLGNPNRSQLYNETRCTKRRGGYNPAMTEFDPRHPAQPIAQARANLTKLVNAVQLLRLVVILTSRGRPVAALVPADLGQLVRQVGGPDVVVDLLKQHLGGPGTNTQTPTE